MEYYKDGGYAAPADIPNRGSDSAIMANPSRNRLWVKWQWQMANAINGGDEDEGMDETGVEETGVEGTDVEETGVEETGEHQFTTPAGQADQYSGGQNGQQPEVVPDSVLEMRDYTPSISDRNSLLFMILISTRRWSEIARNIAERPIDRKMLEYVEQYRDELYAFADEAGRLERPLDVLYWPDFCNMNGIEHIFPPPFHPQSNGQAERFVDTFKRTLCKFKGEETTSEALQTFLLSYRTTPIPILNNQSPAEMLLGRRWHSCTLCHPTLKTSKNFAHINGFDSTHHT